MRYSPVKSEWISFRKLEFFLYNLCYLRYLTVYGYWSIVSVYPPQMQMLQVWLQVPERTGGLQVPSLTEGGPGRTYIRDNSIWKQLETILWHSCK